MSGLRERLKSDCPDLWHVLEHSWQLATTRWLPSVDAASSSESFNSYPHLKNLETHLDRIATAYEQSSAKSLHTIAALDLSAVEIYVICAAILFHDMGRMRGGEHHGKHTKEILLDEGRYAELGIPSLELAGPIADICEFHTERDATHLSARAVHPYGIVRCRELAALLLLIDEMDDTFNRTLLECLRIAPDFKARFRRLIREVYVDPRRQTMFTVLDSKDNDTFNIHTKILGTKVTMLQAIRNDLARLGLCVNGWRLEYDEHLYDEKGQETYEACFYPGYLDELVSQMWDLSTQILGAASFTYENLAAAMREKNVEKIRVAVNRLAIITRRSGTDSRANLGIWAGKDHWKWLMHRDAESHCLFASPCDVTNRQPNAEQSRICPPPMKRPVS